VGEPFRHRLRVRYHECDPQGVVFNANYLAYCDICLVELWREVVEGHAGMAAKGIDVVVAEARIRFLAPLRFDDEVEMSLTITSLGTTSMQL
jgi:acyl-CoA thioester hydrolase